MHWKLNFDVDLFIRGIRVLITEIFVYKYKSPEVSQRLYQEYAAGLIKTEQEFRKRVQESEVSHNG